MGSSMVAPNQCLMSVATQAAETDPVAAAELIFRRYGARAVSMLTGGRTAPCGEGRLSANDAYVAMQDACRKMARVAIRRWRRTSAGDAPLADVLGTLFPEPAAYLARAIKSVIADAGRAERREIRTASLDEPVAQGRTDGSLPLLDTIADPSPDSAPDHDILLLDDRTEFRSALRHALRAIPSNYLEALRRDMARDRQREAGVALAAQSDRDRQTVCRARAAVARILQSECSDGNPYIQTIMHQRSNRVPRKRQPAATWSGERQDALFRRLMETGWAERATADPSGRVEEALVNDVTAAAPVAPPTPELRQAMRVLDLYTVDRPTPATPVARELYAKARAHREAGRIEEALASYRDCHDAEPAFVEALNEVGVMHSRLGQLREALRVYLSIVDSGAGADHRYIAATNAADIYLTWYDAGRNREHNLEQARHYAAMAMQKPTPMRACNLLLALVKDRYYEDARRTLEDVIRVNSQACPAERFLQTLFQIRDADLVTWWNWLETEMETEQVR